MNVYYSPENFINRELSWIEFNQRVLEEAQDTSNPLFERLKFKSIVSSNLDEFFMIRVGSLCDQITAGFNKPDAAGLTPVCQMEKISIRVHKLVYDQLNCYNRSLKLALRKEKIFFLKPKDLNEEQCQYIKEYYFKDIYPVITPMVVDTSSPFPLILNRSLNIGLLLQKGEASDEQIFATIQVPSVLERIIEVPYDNGKAFVFLEDIIKMNLSSLFNSHKIIASSCYRITRNADLTLDEEGAEDLLDAIEESLKQRKWGNVVRVELEIGMDKRLLHILEEELEISKEQEYEINGPIDLTFLMKFIKKIGYNNLLYSHMKPQVSDEFLKTNNIFESISKNDILLHHPYDSLNQLLIL